SIVLIGCYSELAGAYRSPFIGDAHSTFIQYLQEIDKRARMGGGQPTYGKSISVIQSSGTGKSRMLTEVGTHIFTLPICLRNPRDEGYPLSDEPAFEYFRSFRHFEHFNHWCDDNYLCINTLSGIACFLAAAYEMMLSALKEIQEEVGHDAKKILGNWHQKMEKSRSRNYRDKFFSAVAERGKEVKISVLVLSGSTDEWLSYKDRSVDPKNAMVLGDITKVIQVHYENHMKKALEALMVFIATLTSDICVIYFDEAHELQSAFRIMLRLLNVQEISLKMWYVFMGTESPMLFFAPHQHASLEELRESYLKLPSMYFSLGFDHLAIMNAHTPKIVKMGDFETIQHLAQYGRPLWHVQVHEGISDNMTFAASKLTGGRAFDVEDVNHVFAVLSQRLCLEPVMSSMMAVKLAEQSVTHHMRLLTGLSFGGLAFHTNSPSEPILSLGAASLLHGLKWNGALETLALKLCSKGLVAKGHVGELAARFLLLVARDYTAPRYYHLLKPVQLLDVLRTLFGDLMWDGGSMEAAFKDAYVNFTHWAITQDPLPEEPTKKLLSDLWARKVILQCCFNEGMVDFLCPVYFGSVLPEAVFDPDQFSALVVQVAFKDVYPQRNLRPTAIIRHQNDHFPYLLLLIELDTDSQRKSIAGEINFFPPKLTDYQKLKTELEDALENLFKYEAQKLAWQPPDEKLKKLRVEVETKQREKDLYNRYVISARGTGPDTYAILSKPGIMRPFEVLLASIAPRVTDLDILTGHMHPLEPSKDGHSHADWMYNYEM
ncbi:uncharacterized protein EI90DRAFT_2923766, partial [Cantharellus anzutake]|uniref:uncharacterized protein n=1 Tax=Cantharellus anzutake TaxID=1750568 RepID=UPI00190855FC